MLSRVGVYRGTGFYEHAIFFGIVFFDAFSVYALFDGVCVAVFVSCFLLFSFLDAFYNVDVAFLVEL